MPVSEIREVLVTLAGYNNRWQSEDNNQCETQLSSDGEILPNARRTLLNDLLVTGSVYRNLVALTVKLRESPSLLVNAVCAEINKHLRGYTEFIGQLEARVVERDTTLTKGQDQVSLTVLRSVVQPHAQILYHLRDITSTLRAVVDEDDKTNTAVLLSSLRMQTLTGYPRMKHIADGFLGLAEKVYLQQIRAWCLYGTLLSNYPGDFLVQQSSTTQGHVLNLQLCPDYIYHETAVNIFRIGHIRARLHEHYPLYSAGSYESEYIHLHDAILGRICLPIDPDYLQSTIIELQKSFSENVLTKAIPKSLFSSLLALIQGYCMLDDGYFALQLVTCVEQDFRSFRARDMGQLTDNVVQAIFAKSLSKKSIARKDSESTDADLEEQNAVDDSIFSLTLAKTHNADSSIDHTSFKDLLFGLPIDMHISVGWPMDVLLLEEDITIYTDIFHYLIAIRRAQQLLQDLWRGRRDEIKHPTTSRATWTTAFRVLYFLESLSEYHHADLIGQFRKRVQTMLVEGLEVYDLIGLAARHRLELHKLRGRILYKNRIPMASLRKLLISVDLMLNALRSNRSEALSKHSIDMLECIDTFKEQISLEPGTEGLLLKLQLGT